ncbi:hypothetical protein ABD05_12300 [Burkholderia pyrrocinia]|nr:hypothetical protein ABD05_12300 [Burkholderia pyrrocinia]
MQIKNAIFCFMRDTIIQLEFRLFANRLGKTDFYWLTSDDVENFFILRVPAGKNSLLEVICIYGVDALIALLVGIFEYRAKGL